MARHSQEEPVTRREKLHQLWERKRTLLVGIVIAALGLSVGGGAWAVAATSTNGTLGVVCDPATIDPVTGKVLIPCTVNGLPVPAPSDSVSPTPSDSPSPSPSPTSTSPSPTPTTTSPSPTPSSSTSPAGNCPVAGKNVAGAADPWGGCWPGPGNTGVPAGTVLTAYAGPCKITKANTVLDAVLFDASKMTGCGGVLLIAAPNVQITRSSFVGVMIDNDASAGSSFTIADSTMVNPARDWCDCIGDHDFTATRINVSGGTRGFGCDHNCTVIDSWVHGQTLPVNQHSSALRQGNYTSATHNTLTCDFNTTGITDDRGCSAAVVGYGDLAPVHHNTFNRNLFAAPWAYFCIYGGTNTGTQYANSPGEGSYIVYTDNVFTLKAPGSCGLPGGGGSTDYDATKPGNVWTGNVWTDGKVVTGDM